MIVGPGGQPDLAPGLYLVNGNVTFRGANRVLNNVTVVATGTITFNGAASRLTPFVDGMGLVSFASGNAITYNGAKQESSGVIFAPNGQITNNGGPHCHTSSLIADTITINGAANFTVTAADGGGGGEITTQVRLVQ